MTEENIFETETDLKQVKRAIYRSSAVVFIVLSALCCLAVFISWQTFVFFEIIAAISCAVALVRKQPDYSLRFEGARLFITDKRTGEKFEVFDVAVEDFVISQTKSEVKTDHCSMMIKNTVLAFGGLKKCSEMREYISQNFR